MKELIKQMFTKKTSANKYALVIVKEDGKFVCATIDIIDKNLNMKTVMRFGNEKDAVINYYNMVR